MGDGGLKIAVDARALLEPPCGIKRYLKCLLESLLRIDSAAEYLLYTNAPLNKVPGNATKRMSVKVLKGSLQTLRRPLWEAVKLRRALRREKLDLFFSPFGTVPPGIAIPSVVTIHDLAFLKFPTIQPWHYRLYWNRTLRRISRADTLIAVSHSTKKDAVELLDVLPEDVTVIWEAPDSQFSSPSSAEEIKDFRTRYGLKGDYVLSVGRREPRKNLVTLATAMRQLNTYLEPTIPLVLAGCKGWGNLQDFRSFGSWVRVLDNVKDSELKHLYSAATVFAFPSIYEGFGLPVLEAMSCGTPVIASNVSSLPELTADAAILLDPHEVSSWEQWIQKLVTNEKLRQQLSAKGLDRAKTFSWDTTARQTLQVFLNTVESSVG